MTSYAPLPRYPWKQWFSKRSFRVERHREFECQPHSMAAQIRAQAASRGVHVAISIEEDVITVIIRDRPIRRRRKVS